MKNGTLKDVKKAMSHDRDFRKMLVRGSKDEILIDLDGDSQADVALIDLNGSGNIDTIAVDLTGDGEFNLYFTDTDDNGVPDMILYDEDGAGKEFSLLGFGIEVEQMLIDAVNAVRLALLAEDYIADAIEEALNELDRDVKLARKELRKR
ncbi:MAG: hypothetical protein LUG52_01215 [Clostridia bacterium]|nr:hypothetical protein [Clostridia bacterium]